MHIMKVDPRALKDNPDRTRQTKSTPQADALLLATIKAVGLVQPPVIAPETGGGNGYIIDSGHRRVKQAIKAGLEEIEFWWSMPPTTMARCAPWSKTSPASR